jgi:hypothetical protein
MLVIESIDLLLMALWVNFRYWACFDSSCEGIPLYHRYARENEHGKSDYIS